MVVIVVVVLLLVVVVYSYSADTVKIELIRNRSTLIFQIF